MKYEFRQLSISLALALTAFNSSGAGLQSQMDKVFGDMSNATTPGIYETQRRGVLAGGRYTAKSKIFDENLVTFTPPSWKAGCGGVDMFGGSFSFINAEQLVQLLRSIAANAKGYAFQLALDNVAPDISKHIQTFQRAIQELNQHLGNSCQLAQGVVNDLTSGLDLKLKTDASISGTVSGLFDDFFDSKQETRGTTPMKSLLDNNPAKYKEMTGNLLWKQLKKNSSASWFQGGDNQLLEAIMSITGTLIIGNLQNDTSGSETNNPNTNPINYIQGGKIKLESMIHGGQVTAYTCPDTNECSTISDGMINLKGLKTQILEMLLGTNTNVGIISKYANNTGTLTDQEKAFSANLPAGMGAIFRNLSALSPDSARIMAQESSNAIATAMVMSIIEDFYKVANGVLTNTDNAYKLQLLDLINDSRQSVYKEYDALTSEYGNVSDLILKYNIILENTRKQRYMASSLNIPAKTN